MFWDLRSRVPVNPHAKKSTDINHRLALKLAELEAEKLAGRLGPPVRRLKDMPAEEAARIRAELEARANAPPNPLVQRAREMERAAASSRRREASRRKR